MKFQLEYVNREITRLGTESDEAILLETPEEMAKVAAEFNQVLDKALETLPVLQGLHEKALELETKFHALGNSRQNASSRLDKVEPLDLKESLGKLALAPAPWGFVFRPAEKLPVFIQNLMGYRDKVAAYKPTEAPEAKEEIGTPRNFFKWLPERWLD